MTWFDGGAPPDPFRDARGSGRAPGPDVGRGPHPGRGTGSDPGATAGARAGYGVGSSPRPGRAAAAGQRGAEDVGRAAAGWRAPAPPAPLARAAVPALPPHVASVPAPPAVPGQVPDAAPSSAGGTGGRARLRLAAERASGPDGLGPSVWSEDAADPGPPWHALGVVEEPAEPSRRPGLLAAVRWRVRPRTAGAAVVALALVGGAVALRAASLPSEPAVVIPEPVASASVAAPVSAGAQEEVVWVHVVGRVAAPGLVSLPVGSRVAEAVAAAGGALPDADLSAVNLAAQVADGSQVHVPAPGEAPALAEQPAASGGDPATVDVNAAGAGELETLPGIGPVLAERIVSWRDEHGPFADVDALQDVPGIGPSVLAQIRSRVRV